MFLEMYPSYQKLTACVNVVSIQLIAIFDFTYIYHQVLSEEYCELFLRYDYVLKLLKM